MRKDSFTIHFFPMQTKKSKCGSYPIYLRITVNREKAVISTKQQVHNLEDWDPTLERLKFRSPVNNALNQFEAEVIDKYNELKYLKQPISATAIKQKFLKSDELKRVYFGEWLQQHLKTKIETDLTLKENTKKNYRTTVKHTLKFLNERNKLRVFLDEVDHKLVKEIEQFFCSLPSSRDEKTTICRNSVNKYLVKLKVMLTVATEEKLIESSPFKGVVLPTATTNVTFLTSSEISALETHPLASNESLIRVRDIFLFSVYTGLRFSDACAVTHYNIERDQGKAWLVFNMKKTEKPLRIPLLQKAEAIIEKYKNYYYKGKINRGLVPDVSNQKVNVYLKTIANLVGIHKNLTHNVARHSMATTVFLGNGIPLEMVQKQLGHSSIRTTQIYAKVTNYALVGAVDKIDQMLAQ